MTTKIMSQEEVKDLEYVLDDYLELKAGLHSSQGKPLKQFLFTQSLDGGHLSSVEGLLLANHLVVFDSGDPAAVEHLLFVSPGEGSLRVRSLK